MILKEEDSMETWSLLFFSRQTQFLYWNTCLKGAKCMLWNAEDELTLWAYFCMGNTKSDRKSK